MLVPLACLTQLLLLDLTDLGGAYDLQGNVCALQGFRHLLWLQLHLPWIADHIGVSGVARMLKGLPVFENLKLRTPLASQVVPAITQAYEYINGNTESEHQPRLLRLRSMNINISKRQAPTSLGSLNNAPFFAALQYLLLQPDKYVRV